MSEVQTGMTTVNDTISMADLMRAEEERRAAELAERMRREAEERRRALSDARQRTALAHMELSGLEQSLVDMKSRLPDLTFLFGELPDMPTGGDLQEWQEHAGLVTTLIRHWKNDFQQAVNVAEETLRRRLRTQKAWEDHRRLTAEIAAHAEQLKTLENLLPDVKRHVQPAFPAPPIPGAVYEDIEAVNLSISNSVSRLRSEIDRLTRIGLCNDRLAQSVRDAALPYDMVTAGKKVEDWYTAHDEQALRMFESRMKPALTKSGFCEDDLPMDLALCLARIRTGLATAENTDFFNRLLRAASIRDSREQARQLLEKAPDYIPPELAETWHFILTALEQAAAGHGELTTTLVRSHADLHEQSRKAMKQAYVFAQTRAAMAECGMIVEDGVIDIGFDEEKNQRKIMAFTLPGFKGLNVLFAMEPNGHTDVIPIRDNDLETSYEKARDIEFNNAVCHRLEDAFSSLKNSGITVDLTKADLEHPVVPASTLGLKVTKNDRYAEQKKTMERKI